MRALWKSLFRIRLRHGFYAAAVPGDQLAIRPTPATQIWAAERGLIWRFLHDGLALVAEVIPENTPSRLLRPLDSTSVRLSFMVEATSTSIDNITELPNHQPGRNVFYFTNLREDIDQQGRKLLGDSFAGVRIGAPIELVTGPIYTYTFGEALNTAKVTVQNLFGKILGDVEMRLPSGEKTNEFRLDVSAVVGLYRGRLLLTDDKGGVHGIYFDPDLKSMSALCVVDIFSDTSEITPDTSNRVPVSYRFIDGTDHIGAVDAYYLQFEPRATTWRYNVIKKYANNGVSLNQLSVSSNGINFSIESSTSNKKIFSSTATVPLSEAGRVVRLMKNGSELRRLPPPGSTTPLSAGAGGWASDLFVYV